LLSALQAFPQGITSSTSTFEDPFKDLTIERRQHMLRHLKAKTDRIVLIAEREKAKVERSKRPQVLPTCVNATSQNEAVITALQASYEGPGHERHDGPRHDNDFADISEIRIAPTHSELVCRIDPFLPANFYGAPHHLPASSVERLLDIQFRLLREELTAPLRSSVQLILDDLLARGKTQLAELLKKGGGRYRGHAGGRDNIMFNVYSNVNVLNFAPDRRGISIGLSFDAPPGRARLPQAKARATFWESGKRLMQGGLIALAWKSGRDSVVHLGILASSLQEIMDSAKRHQNHVSARVVFFDPSVELRILQSLKHPEHEVQNTRVLIEAPVMFEVHERFCYYCSMTDRLYIVDSPILRNIATRRAEFHSVFPVSYTATSGRHPFYDYLTSGLCNCTWFFISAGLSLSRIGRYSRLAAFRHRSCIGGECSTAASGE
jgi:hypothetical protein